MKNKITKENIKDFLVGRKIIDLAFLPYINIKLDDNSEVEIIPEEITMSDFKYLDLSFKQKVGDEKDAD